jgi:hypothetical protein
MGDAKGQSKDSSLNNIINAGASRFSSPSKIAQAAASLAPSGAEEAVARGLQAAVNIGVAGSSEFMAATVRQHGRSPSAVLQDMKIQQAINAQKTNQPAVNKGIEAARQKAAANQGIQSSHSKAGEVQSNTGGQER